MALNEITKGMSNAAEMIDGNFKKIDPMVEDTGWLPLPLTNPQFVSFSADLLPMYRRVGNVVSITGSIKNTAVIPASASPLIITDLPSVIVPSRDFTQRQQGSSLNTFLYNVSATDKALTISRYGTTTQSEIIVGAWLNIHVTYIV